MLRLSDRHNPRAVDEYLNPEKFKTDQKRPWGLQVPTVKALNEIASRRIVIFGEHVPCHNQVIAFFKAIIGNSLLKLKEGSNKLHLFISHFNFEMQFFLDDFSAGKITFEELLE